MLFATEILNKYINYIDSGLVQRHVFQALNETKAEIEGRIFDSESGAEDSEGKKLGAYSKQYARYRNAHGYNSTKKDLEFTGDLRRSIKIEETEFGGRIFVDNSSSISKYKRVKKSKKPQKTTTITNINKAKHIETYQAKKGNSKIFRISDSELINFNKKYKQLIIADIKKLIQNG